MFKISLILNSYFSLDIRKKLEQMSKKGCPELSPWVKSIVNHLYWVASSSKDSSPDMLEAKWVSIVNHIVNIHSHKNNLFKKCGHGHKKKGDKKKKWLKPSNNIAYNYQKYFWLPALFLIKKVIGNYFKLKKYYCLKMILF